MRVSDYSNGQSTHDGWVATEYYTKTGRVFVCNGKTREYKLNKNIRSSGTFEDLRIGSLFTLDNYLYIKLTENIAYSFKDEKRIHNSDSQIVESNGHFEIMYKDENTTHIVNKHGYSVSVETDNDQRLGW